jgi:hypothetical protein
MMVSVRCPVRLLSACRDVLGGSNRAWRAEQSDAADWHSVRLVMTGEGTAPWGIDSAYQHSFDRALVDAVRFDNATSSYDGASN